MNELIKYFNKEYSKTHGKIAYPRTTLQIYQVYQIIKSFGIEDEKLNKLLDEAILPKPKTTEEKEAYAECIYESVNIPASRKYVDGNFPKKTSIEDNKLYLLKESGEKIDEGTELPSTDVSKEYVDTSLKSKVDKVTGKGLSTVDFTKSYETKLKGLENYNDTKVKEDIKTINTQLGDIVNKKLRINIKYPPAPLIGAKGDGVTDDTLAIQNILNTKPNYIYIPKGEYMCSNLILKDSIKIEGEGKSISILKRIPSINIKDSKYDLYNSSIISNHIKGTENQYNNVSIKNITIDGNKDNITLPTNASELNDSNSWHNLSLKNIESLHIENCSFINSIGNGTDLYSIINGYIINNNFTNCGGNILGTMARNALTVRGSFYNTITNQTIYNKCSYFIKNNVFDTVNDEGIYVNNCFVCDINDNVFENIGQYIIEYINNSTTFGSIVNFKNNIIDSFGENCFNLDKSITKSYFNIESNHITGIGDYTANHNTKKELNIIADTSYPSNNIVNCKNNYVYINNDKVVYFAFSVNDISIIGNTIICDSQTRLCRVRRMVLSDNKCIFSKGMDKFISSSTENGDGEFEIINNNIIVSNTTTLNKFININFSLNSLVLTNNIINCNYNNIVNLWRDSGAINIENMCIKNNDLNSVDYVVGLQPETNSTYAINKLIFINNLLYTDKQIASDVIAKSQKVINNNNININS